MSVTGRQRDRQTETDRKTEKDRQRYLLKQQWITDIYRYKCTGYTYIINKKVQTYRQAYRQRVRQTTS